MKRNFTKKNEITHKIRDFFREGGSTSDVEGVVKFVKDLDERYVLTPELLAFIVQKVNAFQLFQVFKENKAKQVYPKINLINVVDFCREHFGYEDIYARIHSNLLSKIDDRSIKKAASLNYYSELNKAASKNENIRNTLEKDEKMTDIKKFAESKLHHKFNMLVENYWSLMNIENFIKVSKLDTDVNLKEILDVLRDSKITTYRKEASLSTYLEFEKSLREFREESDKLGE